MTNQQNAVLARTERLCQYLKKNYLKSYPVGSGGNFHVKSGRKYLKIIHENSSVHAFVDKKTGDVFKPASWNAPAKHVRYNLLDEKSFTECITRADWAGGYLYIR